MAERVNYGKLREVLEVPNLINVQLGSYTEFLQMDAPPEKRKNQGLQEIFLEIFPIESYDQQYVLDFVSYSIGKPKIKIIDCLKDGESYSAPLHVELRIDCKGEIKTESVYMGEIPLMTEKGTFVINGAERVIISQLHRSPGVCFEKKQHTSGKTLYSFRIIPDRGSWLEVQYDINDNIFIFLDRRRRRRKFLITTLMRAIGFSTDREIIEQIHEIVTKTPASLSKEKDISVYYTVEDITDSDGEVIIQAYSALTEHALKEIKVQKIKKLNLVYIPNKADYLLKCLRRDPSSDTDEALKEIYRRMRPGDPPSINNAKQLLQRLFFDVRRYDLGLVGRYKINQKFGLDTPDNVRTLTNTDLIGATKYLINLKATAGAVDDIDHLGNRRIRTVGEQIQNQCRIGLVRTERLIRERMTLLGMNDSNVTPGKLVNPKAFASVIRDFFARNQLSQFMDQTNPLSEMTNKRRLSALGPGGLNRERAGFEVRDVHSSHYGRICPIETPEGPNIGLISSVSLYTRVNEFGFLETPYRVVKDKIVSDKIEYLTADVEEEYVIAQANAPLDKEGKFINKTAMSRFRGDSMEIPTDKINYMDVSPKQLVSAAAGLIPFLEHDDANRALMGSNMQRQAVPLLTTESPLVGTGLEHRIAVDTKAVLTAEKDGIVESVSGDKVVVTSDGKSPEHTADKSEIQIFNLYKYLRTNAGTSINQRPIVHSGQKIKAGDVVADGAATDGGELALGKNLTVAFMPWGGYNFEDAIVISEKVVKEDIYTSIHVSEYETSARDTKLGPEEITRDIPNVSEEALKNLGPDGIIKTGSEVRPGDILVGKITPKSETELAPEERLLRAIFGEKAADVKDSSLTVGSGTYGTVMDVRIEHAKSSKRSSMTKTEIRRQTKQIKDNAKAEIASLTEDLIEEFAEFLFKEKLPHPIFDESSSKPDMVLISSNRRVTMSGISKLANKFRHYRMNDCPIKRQIDEVIEKYKPKFDKIERDRDEQIESIENGQNIKFGSIKKVKVYIATKHKLQVGDKMAGRHGNKGIVAKIVPEEDMPFLDDGEPVDIVLNPLGVPSRMNVGQVLETHLGLAARLLNIKTSTPVFDGATEDQIVDLLVKGNEQYEKDNGRNLHFGFMKKDGKWVFDGKANVYDGRDGIKFDQRITIGKIYMLKLDHLVANKLHARSVGPYSLVTQQPLGGKAQHGGQRFGEMEVWALEAYGAAYSLQEMLTVKSDDVVGRTKIYESIVKGKCSLEPGRPESFNVLIKELQSLGLDIQILKKEDELSTDDKETA
ncbi:MAG: DNA-directed RNA polymerase subunit beta [Victivallales bacterium]|nr:DNA-directed RNA polymerase subunit beta [Victivallales bacterium]MCF7889205.1 DNA-directed RNA polymerase subunit beta [Victivallales bacterium]